MTKEMGHDSHNTSYDRISPCPCCGSEAFMNQVPYDPQSENSGGYYIECGNRRCGITTRLVFCIKDDGRRDLVETWNKRCTHFSTFAGS